MPQDRLTVIVVGNAYGSAAVSSVAGHLARLHLPALRFQPIADPEPAKAAQVLDFLSHRADAAPCSRPVTPAMAKRLIEFWSARRAYYRALGVPVSAQLVALETVRAKTWFRYRVKYADTVRLVRVKFDAQGLIDGMSSEDE